MAIFAKDLMDFYFAESRRALAKEDYEAAQVWSSAEGLVNNVMHGLHPNEWLPRLDLALRSNAVSEWVTAEEAPVWIEAADFAELMWKEVNN